MKPAVIVMHAVTAWRSAVRTGGATAFTSASTAMCTFAR
jgi:hypothetical protein